MVACPPLRVLVATTATPDDRKTLACVRSLGRAGDWVGVAGDRFPGQAFHSRFVRRRARTPHPRDGADAWVASLNEHVRRDGYEVVIPTSDYATLALTRARDALEPSVATALPPRDAVEIASDKTRTLALARELGIETPETHEVDGEDALRAAAERVAFPCVIKLRRGSGAVGFRVLQAREDLAAAVRAARPPSDLAFDRDHLLVQEYVPGETRDACVVCRHGEIRAGLTQRRVRTWPREGGVTTLAVTTREPELLERAGRILGALRWHGPAQVEFKVDAASGRRWLIEINGRFWGSTDVSVAAGIDAPWLTRRLAAEGDVPPTTAYEVGLRYRYPFPYALFAMVEGDGRREALRAFLAPAPGVRSDLRWDDPLPHLAEAAFIARRAWQRRSLRPERKRL